MRERRRFHETIEDVEGGRDEDVDVDVDVDEDGDEEGDGERRRLAGTADCGSRRRLVVAHGGGGTATLQRLSTVSPSGIA